jgi:hypothetical protein
MNSIDKLLEYITTRKSELANELITETVSGNESKSNNIRHALAELEIIETVLSDDHT